MLQQVKEAVEAYNDREDCAQMLEEMGCWRFSWDNDNIHTRAHVSSLHLEQVKLPTYSPDMHCVVEHTVSRTWRMFKRRAALLLGPDDSVEEYKDLVTKCFEIVALPETISKDVVRLPLIYKVISTPKGQYVGEYEGSGGDWPHPHLYH